MSELLNSGFDLYKAHLHNKKMIEELEEEKKDIEERLLAFKSLVKIYEELPLEVRESYELKKKKDE